MEERGLLPLCFHASVPVGKEKMIGKPAHLAISHLRVSLDRQGRAVPVIDDLSLDIQEGEIVGVVGESGSGKTMTALAVLQLLPRGARVTGSIKLEGQELLDLPESEMRQVRGARVGMVFQEPVAALNPVFTVGAQLQAAIRAHEKLAGLTLSVEEKVAATAIPLKKAFDEHEVQEFKKFLDKVKPQDFRQ